MKEYTIQLTEKQSQQIVRLAQYDQSGAYTIWKSALQAIINNNDAALAAKVGPGIAFGEDTPEFKEWVQLLTTQEGREEAMKRASE